MENSTQLYMLHNYFKTIFSSDCARVIRCANKNVKFYEGTCNAYSSGYYSRKVASTASGTNLTTHLPNSSPISQREKKHVPISMRNSCTSVFPNNRVCEQDELNKNAQEGKNEMNK